jgi:arsenate reductase (thioredoxin)
MINVLILCTGNSCRSVIGEALINHLCEGRIRAWSAGSYPTGTVNPKAISVLKLHDVPIVGLSSKSWDELDNIEFDIVISVCDRAQGETCPIYLNKTLKAHWGLPDPAEVVGEEKEIREAFESTYLALHKRIALMLALPLEKLGERELTDRLNEIGTIED